jgi:hypothetical protein
METALVARGTRREHDRARHPTKEEPMRIRPPSPPLVIAALALVIALGGTSYAAITLPPGSVGTKQLKNHAVTPVKLSKLQAWHVVGAPGQPAFQSPWGNWNSSVAGLAAFRRDRDRMVHLRGAVDAGANIGGGIIFTLPPKYRPAKYRYFSVASTDGGSNPVDGIIEIRPDGTIYCYSATDDRFVSLDQIAFYAGG